MAVSKTAATVQASTSNAAGATTNSSRRALATAFGAIITAKVTNGGSGPTLGCTVNVQVSDDGAGGNWKTIFSQSAGVTASIVYEFFFELPPPTMDYRVQFTGNTVQAVTVESFAHEFTSVA